MGNFNQPREIPSQTALARLSDTAAYVPYSDAAFERDYESDSAIMEYLRILRRHRRSVIIFAVIGLALGIVVTALRTPVYRATTFLEVLNLNEDFMNLRQSSPVSESDASYDTSEVETQVKILQNDELIDRVMAKMDPYFKTRGTQPKPLRNAAGWRAWLKLTPPVNMTSRQTLIGKAASSLKVKATPRTRVIQATVDSTDPQLAADFANTLDGEFIEQNLEARWKTTQHMGDWLGRELGDARSKLAGSEDALQSYARNSGLIFTSEDSSVATEKLQQLQQQLSAATADRIAKQSRYELAQNTPPDALPDVLNDVAYRESQAKLNELNSQIADLSAVYNPEYSKLKQVKAQAAALEAALERNRAEITARISNEYTDALRKEKLLAESYQAQTHEVTGEGEKAIQYNILKREVDSNRQLYDLMLQQLKQSSIATAIRASNVRIVNAAKPPSSPVSPNVLAII